MPNVVDCTAVFDPARILQDHLPPSAPSEQPSPAPAPGSAAAGTHSSSAKADSGNTSDAWIALKYSARSYLFLLAPSDNIAKTTDQDAIEASNDLRIIVKVGDTLRVRSTSLALRRDNQCFIKQMDIASGELCITAPTLRQRASTSSVLDASVTTLNQVKPVPLIDSCWEFTAIQTGLAAANVKFQIFDDKATVRGNFACTLWYMVQP